jgi:hypothetical protein
MTDTENGEFFYGLILLEFYFLGEGKGYARKHQFVYNANTVQLRVSHLFSTCAVFI